MQNIILSLEDRDAEELILVLCGYYRLLTDRELEVIQEKSRWSEEQGKNNYYMNKKIQYIFQINFYLLIFSAVCKELESFLNYIYLNYL